MKDISELKIAIDKASKEMYELFGDRDYVRAWDKADELITLSKHAREQCELNMLKLRQIGERSSK